MHDRLFAAQADRLRALTPWPEPPARPTGEVVEVDGAVTGLDVTTWDPSAFERVVLGDRTATLTGTALPDPAAPGAAAAVAALLDAVEARLPTAPGLRTQLLLRWPSADRAALALLTGAGLHVDAHWCTRPATEPLPEPAAPESPAAVRVRPAEPRDAPAVTALAVEEVRFHVPLTPFTRDLPVIAPQMRRLAATSDPAAPLLVAESTGPHPEVLGFALCSLTDTPTTGAVRPPGRSGHLRSVGVGAAARGRGVGGALVSGAARALIAAGATTLTVAYLPTNPLAAPFWTGRGFRPAWHYLAAILPRAAAEPDGVTGC